jgi:Tfp pilus assembly protein PilF
VAGAADWLRETLRLDPKHFGAMTYLGMCAEHLGHNDAAGRLYQAAIRESKLQGKPFAWAFLGYGKLLRQEGKDSQAIAVLEEAERTCPEAHVLSTLGQALAAEHQNSRAQAVLRRAIEMDPSIFEAHYRLSLLLRNSGHLQEAQTELKLYQETKKMDEQNRTRISAIRK